MFKISITSDYYTIPSDNRELQPSALMYQSAVDYTIPSDNRELQLENRWFETEPYYTIPSDNRELQPDGAV